MPFLYNTFKNPKKERFGIILEPLQALLQLALLSFTPLDTKLTIGNNILYIQAATWNQGVVRSYYNDSKNDLFYLFNVFIRFNKFYQHLKCIKNGDNNNSISNSTSNGNDSYSDNGDNIITLFTLLKDLATKGIDNLLQTYKQTDNPALLHTLNIYKNLLNNPEQQFSLDQQNQQNQQNQYNNVITNNETHPIVNTGPVDIDNVFISITKLYTEQDLIIIFNTLQLINKNPTNYLDYTEGLNKLLEPINKQIQKWIVDHIVY